MTEQTCEKCGHKKGNHKSADGIYYYYCVIRGCKCKKFIPEKEICLCGHIKLAHGCSQKCVGFGCKGECHHLTCSCKKFQPVQKGCGKLIYLGVYHGQTQNENRYCNDKELCPECLKSAEKNHSPILPKTIVPGIEKEGNSKSLSEKKKRGFVRQLDFRPAFVWEEEIEDFVKKKMKGYTLNVPCGQSKLGDVRLDIDPKLSMREAYDFFKDDLDFPDNTFDTIISDPPWKIGHYFKPKLFFRLVEVCKVGGIIIYNAIWIPTSKYVKLKECWIRQSSQFSNVSIISVFEKIAEVPKKELKKTKGDNLI